MPWEMGGVSVLLSSSNKFQTQFARHVCAFFGLFCSVFPFASANAGGRTPLANHPAAIIDVTTPEKIATFAFIAPSQSYYDRAFVNSDKNLFSHYLLSHAPVAEGLRARGAAYEFQRTEVFWSLQEEINTRSGLANAALQERMQRMTYEYFQSNERPSATRKAIALSQNVRSSQVSLSGEGSSGTQLHFGYDYFIDQTNVGLSSRQFMGRVQRTGLFNTLAIPQTRVECVGYLGASFADVAVGYLIEESVLDTSLTRRVHKSITAQIATRQGVRADYQQFDFRLFFDL